MKIKIISTGHENWLAALFGIGLSYGLTSDIECYTDLIFHKNNDLHKKLFSVSEKLASKDASERKFLRMIPVVLDITAPLTWWKQFDTYKVGTVAQSESTMHTITSKPLSIENFETEGCTRDYIDFIHEVVIPSLNRWIKYYKEAETEEDKKSIFRSIIGLLPSSFLQRRIVTLNYEVIKTIYNQRKNHKLLEWQYFCKSMEGLGFFDEYIRSNNNGTTE